MGKHSKKERKSKFGGFTAFEIVLYRLLSLSLALIFTVGGCVMLSICASKGDWWGTLEFAVTATLIALGQASLGAGLVLTLRKSLIKEGER